MPRTGLRRLHLILITHQKVSKAVDAVEASHQCKPLAQDRQNQVKAYFPLGNIFSAIVCMC